jgi:hypothetical protein
MERSISFYENKLGFNCTYNSTHYESGPINYAVLRRDEICLHLQLFENHQELTMPSLRLVVAEIDVLYKELLERAALTKDVKIHDTPWNTREFGL